MNKIERNCLEVSNKEYEKYLKKETNENYKNCGDGYIGNGIPVEELEDARKSLKKSLKNMGFDISELSKNLLVEKKNEKQASNNFLENIVLMRNIDKYIKCEENTPIWIYTAKPIRNEEYDSINEKYRKENINKNMFLDIKNLERGLYTQNIIDHYYINSLQPMEVELVLLYKMDNKKVSFLNDKIIKNISTENNTFIMESRDNKEKDNFIYIFNFIKELNNKKEKNEKIQSLDDIKLMLKLISNNTEHTVENYFKNIHLTYEMSKMIFYKIQKLAINGTPVSKEKLNKISKSISKENFYIHDETTLLEMCKSLKKERDYVRSNPSKYSSLDFLKKGGDYARFCSEIGDPQKDEKGNYIFEAIIGKIKKYKSGDVEWILNDKDKLMLVDALEQELIRDELERKMVQFCCYSEYLSEFKNTIKIYKKIKESVIIDGIVDQDFINLLRAMEIPQLNIEKNKYEYNNSEIGKKTLSYYLKKASEKRELLYNTIIKRPDNDIIMPISRESNKHQREIYNRNYEKNEALIYIIAYLVKSVLDEKGENVYSDLIDSLEAYYDILIKNKEIYKSCNASKNMFLRIDEIISEAL